MVPLLAIVTVRETGAQYGGQAVKDLAGFYAQVLPADLTAEHFAPLVALAPELVIFGSGERLRFVPPARYRELIEARIETPGGHVNYDGDTAIKLYLREIGQVKLLTVQEEIGLLGAKAFDMSRLEAEVGYVYDVDGDPGAMTMRVCKRRSSGTT